MRSSGHFGLCLGTLHILPGDHQRDTKCERCPNGTFSTERAWNSECKKWTKCASGYHIKQVGTNKSDNICEPSRTHIIIIVIAVLGIVLAVLVLIWCLCTGKSRNLEKCVEWCQGEKPKQKRDGGMLLPQPTVLVEEESTFHDALPSQEETRVTPEENDDESGLEIPSDIALTENGNFVTQEDGKKEVLSRQESQTQTCSGYTCEC